MFRAPYLDRVMKTLEEKWRINAENGKKGGRPRKTKKRAETPAGKGGKPNETQESRVEEKYYYCCKQQQQYWRGKEDCCCCCSDFGFGE